MIPFFRKNFLIHELEYLKVLYTDTGRDFRREVIDYFHNHFKYQNFHLTKSCTQSLEIAIMTLNLPKGSEVILPSYGFVSIANAVVINGLKCVFVDCEPNTMNISFEAIQNAVSSKTKAIITINYSGIACDYDRLIQFTKDAGIYLIEDNAHGIRATYKDQYLGTLGDVSTISFDFFKNINCGEGGGIIINNHRILDSFNKVYHFGTNKKDFLDGNVNAYEWKSIGTNSVIAEHLALVLKCQLDNSEQIIQSFRDNWKFYYSELVPLQNEGYIQLAQIPDYAGHNAHMFWIKVESKQVRDELIQYLKKVFIEATFHYKPLHSSEFGKKIGEFRGEDVYTTKESERILRLPFYYDLRKEDQMIVLEHLYKFFKN